MSILIKGVKMPKEGNYEARLNVNRDGTALLFLFGECGGHEAKELPPHGRLIDADALHYSRLRIYHEDGIVGGYNAVVMSAEIKDAPTIIEAEVKE